MKEWLKLAIRKDVVNRSLRVGLVVGTILIVINYTDRFMRGNLTAFDLFKMTLTYFVPYSVSTYASVSAIRRGH